MSLFFSFLFFFFPSFLGSSFLLSRRDADPPFSSREPDAFLSLSLSKSREKKKKNSFVLQPREEILSELEAAAKDAAAAATRAKEARTAAARVAESTRQDLQELVKGSPALAAAVARAGA